MSGQIDERTERMTVERFKARYTFPLTPGQQEQIQRAEGLGYDLLVTIGYALGRRWLLNVESTEGIE